MLSNSDKAWALCGDFNEVREPSERLNCEFMASRAKRFEDFIVTNNLLDIPLGGRIYTRVSDDGLKFSKLDRSLVFENFVSLWVNLSAVVMERKDSDHCPIRLMDEEKNFGPKPWKIFDCWIDINEADQIVKNTWVSNTAAEGRKDSWFLKKLKKIKVALEIEAEPVTLNQQELDLWKNSRKCWLEKEKVKAGMLKQKAQIRWTLEGDENSKFFHSIILNKEAAELENKFLESKILEAINDCGSTKAPSPDGFNMRFFKKYWDLIKSDLVEAISWFWEKGEISRGCNVSLL
ncbi:uncharacterized protein [Rutidosis leptorrhynchoides]|uniref:uncharacterized protein n=1 Tax=Rutidosis leptorrhynchoides TaxID=125765 RepID=UPI003A9952F2